MQKSPRLESNNYFLWQKQMRLEFDQILWQYGIRKLQPPLFEIIDVHSYWGQWDPVFRRIRISASLIEKHPWDFVLKILKHEMAHQIVSELFAISNDATHGEAFQRACAMLGLEQEFRGYRAHPPAPGNPSSTDPSKTKDSGNTTNNARRLLEKTQRLMALAQSANENEALASMKKVYDLYEKYNLEQLAERWRQGANFQPPFIYKIIYLHSRRIEAHQSHIASLLQEFYFVQIIFSEIFNPQICQRQKTIELFGTEENVAMAEYVFHFLENQILQMWMNFSKAGQHPSKFKRSYLVGLLVGFRAKLHSLKDSPSILKKESSLSMNSTHTSAFEMDKVKALELLSDDPLLQAFIAQRIPRRARRNTGSSGLYSDVYSTGKTDGQTITIHKGITDENRGPKKFLEWPIK